MYQVLLFKSRRHLCKGSISPGFYSNLVLSAFSTECMCGGQQAVILDAEQTPETSLGLFLRLAFLNP